MTGVRLGRLLLLWAGVVAFFASTLYAAIASGEPTGLVGFAAFPVVGAIILTSRPGNGVGQLLYGISLVWTVTAPLTALAFLETSPAWMEVVSIGLGWPSWGLIPLIGLVFPTGRIETRAGRILATVLIAYSTLAGLLTVVETSPLPVTGRPNPLGVAALGPVSEVVLGPAGAILFAATIVGIVVDLGIRWRRSSGAARLQYRWLVFALAVVVVVVGASRLMTLIFAGAPWLPWVSGGLGITINLIPISIGIAVTRHGLYEIGRVVSRTVAFAVVTLVVVGVYAGIVTSASLLLPEQSTAAVAVATLAAAGVFLPVLHRVQRGVERRFDRERYNAQQVVDTFGDRLRTGADPEETTPDLVAAVERALQPRAVGVWTKEDAA